MAHRTIESIISREKNVYAASTLLGAFIVAHVADSKIGEFNRRKVSDKAEVLSTIRDGKFSIFTVPGYHTDGRIIGKNLDRHLGNMGTTHYAVHPQQGFSIDSIKEEWLKARQLDGHRPAKLYAMSMGALLVAKLFSDAGFRSEFGEVDTLVMDSGLSGKRDVRISSKLAMAAATLLPLTYSTGKLYSFITSREAKKEIHHSPDVTHEEAYEHILSSTRTTFDAAKEQILFMNRNDISKMDLLQFSSAITRKISYIASINDGVLDSWQSAHHYAKALNRTIEYRIDTQRSNGEHATGPERPKGPIDALLDINPHDYRIIQVDPT
jgi:hypothetical protein